MFKTSHVLLVALLTTKDCRKVVHELYMPKEIGEEFLFMAVTYAFGSLAFKHYENWKLSALFVLSHSGVLGCVHILSYAF